MNIKPDFNDPVLESGFVNLSELSEKLDAATIKLFLEIFLTETPPLIQKLSRTLSQGNPELSAELARELKCRVAFVGAERLAWLVWTFEHYDGTGVSGVRTRIFFEILKEYAAVERNLRPQFDHHLPDADRFDLTEHILPG